MEAKKYRIRWVINAVRRGKRGKRSISLGFCEKDKKIAFISILGVENVYEFTKPFLVCDVYVNEECEDGRFCWNLGCPHNRATPETLKKYVGRKCNFTEFKKISEKLQVIGEHFISTIDWSKEVQIVFDKPPLILSYKKREKTK